MKFDTYVHKIVVYHQKIFGEDSPIYTNARGVYMRSRNEMSPLGSETIVLDNDIFEESLYVFL